jgi:hypothetical protein
MEPQDEAARKEKQSQAEAAQHVADAHDLLTSLRKNFEKHPQLEQAIEKLEMALSALTMRTGGLL